MLRRWTLSRVSPAIVAGIGGAARCGRGGGLTPRLVRLALPEACPPVVPALRWEPVVDPQRTCVTDFVSSTRRRAFSNVSSGASRQITNVLFAAYVDVDVDWNRTS